MKSFKVSNYKTVSMDDTMYDDFIAWLDHECDGQAPSEPLLYEFLSLEQTFRADLVKAVDRNLKPRNRFSATYKQ